MAHLGHRPLLVGGGLLFAASNIWFALRLGVTPDWLGTWLPGRLVGEAAVGLVRAALCGAAVARLAPAHFGVGNAAMRPVGGPSRSTGRRCRHICSSPASIGPSTWRSARTRGIHAELERARQALERAARQMAALYPEILRLERACDAAIAAQEGGGE